MASPELRLREQDLTGKLAVVTGASKGIGRAVYLNLASRGCSVIGTCSSEDTLHQVDELNDVINALYSSSGATRPSTQMLTSLQANINEPDCASKIAMTVAISYGFVDILINNAAATGLYKIGATTPAQIQESMIANIQTPVLIVDELVKRRLFRPNSRIVYISSTRAKQPGLQSIMYSAGKAAGESLVRTWAEAFGGKHEEYSFMAGTTANAVSVGLTETSTVIRAPPEKVAAFKAECLPQQCLPRLGQPDDVANVIGLLCSPDARWITGSVVSANGGMVKIG